MYLFWICNISVIVYPSQSVSFQAILCHSPCVCNCTCFGSVISLSLFILVSLLASKLFSVIVPVSASVSVCVLSVTVRVILSCVLSDISQFKFSQSVWFIYCIYPSPVRVISLYSLFVNYLIFRHSTIAPCSRSPSFCLCPFVLLSDHLELTTACTTMISASAPLKSSASHIVHLGPHSLSPLHIS